MVNSDPGNVSWGNFVAGSGVLASPAENILRCNPVDQTQNRITSIIITVTFYSTQNLVQDHTTARIPRMLGSNSRNDVFESIRANFLRYKSILDVKVYNGSKGIVGHLNSLAPTTRGSYTLCQFRLREQSVVAEIGQKFCAL